jgi:uncharacterized membrane protein YkvA (DUF1232 family)
MPWYAWVLLAIAVIIAMSAITLRILRANRRGRRFLALSTREKIAFGRALLESPHLGWPTKLVLFAVVGYLAMPIDLIPDFIPVLGQADDALVVALAIIILLRTIPHDVFDAAVAQAAARTRGAAGGGRSDRGGWRGLVE